MVARLTWLALPHAYHLLPSYQNLCFLGEVQNVTFSELVWSGNKFEPFCSLPKPKRKQYSFLGKGF